MQRARAHTDAQQRATHTIYTRRTHALDAHAFTMTAHARATDTYRHDRTRQRNANDWLNAGPCLLLPATTGFDSGGGGRRCQPVRCCSVVCRPARRAGYARSASRAPQSYASPSLIAPRSRATRHCTSQHFWLISDTASCRGCPPGRRRSFRNSKMYLYNNTTRDG